jgi:ethanolamine utilization protein EutQ (cupin superfamily)
MTQPTLITQPSRIQPAGNKPKIIDEFVGHVNSGTASVSIAKMNSPEGWTEPGQRPDFDEFTVVTRGRLHVEFEGGSLDVKAGQAVMTPKGAWVRYSTPDAEGAEYFAVCLPAFSPASVHRDQ